MIRKIYLLLIFSLTIISFFVLMNSHNRVFAVNINFIPRDVQNSLKVFDTNTYPQASDSYNYDCLGQGIYPASPVYQTSGWEWISEQGQSQIDGSSVQPINVNVGATTIPLWNNNMAYICNESLSNQSAIFPIDSSLSINSCNDVLGNNKQNYPFNESNYNGGFQQPCAVKTYVSNATATINGVPAGSFSCLVGQTSEVDFQSNTRYWYPFSGNDKNSSCPNESNPDYFSFNSSPINTNATINITLYQYSITQFCGVENGIPNSCIDDCVQNNNIISISTFDPSKAMNYGCSAQTKTISIMVKVNNPYNLKPLLSPNKNYVLPGEVIKLTSNVTNFGDSYSAPSNLVISNNPNPYQFAVPPLGPMRKSNSYYSYYTVPITANPGTNICFTASVSPSTASNTTAVSNKVCVVVVYAPYFQVNGSDTSVGPDYYTYGQFKSNSGIYSWNNNLGLSNNIGNGSTDQFGAFAPYLINGFASSLINSLNGTNLSFSNEQNNNPNAGNFGGNFGSLPPYLHNYFGDNLSTNPTTVSSIPALSSGVYYYQAPKFGQSITLSSININQGDKLTIYINGNVLINNNIRYSNSGITNLSNISSFKLIVLGNIYISPSVTQLDGVYVAEPFLDSSGSGNIFTCNKATLSTNYSICNSQLQINGSLVANRIQFQRTFKGVNLGEPSEIINYNPLIWLPNINNGKLQVDKIESLPPVL